MNNNSRFSGEMLSDFGVSDCAIDEKRWTNEMLSVPVYSGVLKLRKSTRKGCAGRLR